jgi:flagellar hook assembly protein FlgD
MNNVQFKSLIILLFIISNKITPQITIDGTITDPDNNPISNAYVEIIDQNDSLNNYSTITNSNGYFQISNITDIESFEKYILEDYLLIRNYPNPFNPSTIIYFELAKAENIEITIFDILGREIRTLFSGFHNAGVDQINWDGRNNFNQGVSAGVYLCQLRTKNHFKVHKMVLLDGGGITNSEISNTKLSTVSISKTNAVKSIFNFTVKVTADSIDDMYFRNLTSTNDTTLSLVVSKLFLLETIGPDGGTIGNDDFKVTISSGAINDNYEIAIYNVADDGAFGENTVSPTYKLKGIPVNYSKPLQINAKYSSVLSNSSFTGVGRKIFDVINQDSIIFYDLIEAYDSSGYLISKIPIDSSTINTLSKVTGGEFIDLILKEVTGIKQKRTQHFLLKYPENTDIDTTKILDIFENAFEYAYGYLLYENYPFFYDDWYHPPMVVNLTEMTEVMQDAYYRNNQRFAVNINFARNKQYNKILIEATKRLFLPNSYIDKPSSWHDLSIYYWIESLLTDDPNFKYPQIDDYNFLSNGFVPFNGYNISNPDFTKIKNHALGMTSFLRYLKKVQNVGLGVIGNTFAFNKPVILNSINNWWPDFFAKYINNELYTLPNDYFINPQNYDEDFRIFEWNINSEEGITKTFSSSEVGRYQDLSAKIFKVNLNYEPTDTTYNMLFSMDSQSGLDGLSLVMFGIQDGKTEYLNTAKAEDFEIPKLKSYFDSGVKEFLAVLVNSKITSDDYLGETEIDLTVSIKKDSELSKIKKCAFYLRVNVEKHFENSFGTTVETVDYTLDPLFSAVGSFSGNTFTGSYEHTTIPGDSSKHSGTVIVTLNEDAIFVTVPVKNFSASASKLMFTF